MNAIPQMRNAIRIYREQTGFLDDFALHVSHAVFMELGRDFELVAPLGAGDYFSALEIDGVLMTYRGHPEVTRRLGLDGAIRDIVMPVALPNVRLLNLLRGWFERPDLTISSDERQRARDLYVQARDIGDGDTKGIAHFMFTDVLYTVLDGKPLR